MYHSIDICQDIAEKLRSPSIVYEKVQLEISRGTFPNSQWPDLALASGLPGIACFYATMDHLFPDQRWDQSAHEYFKLTASRCESEGFSSYSLFYGLCGLCFAVFLGSKQGSRYQKLLKKLDGALTQEIEKLLSYFNSESTEYAPYHYNLMHGLSGIIAYLLLRKEDGYLQKLLRDCVEALIKIMRSTKNVGDKAVPAWFVAPQEDQFYSNEHFPQGGFLLSTSTGIIGSLSALSLALWHGIRSPQIEHTIKEIATWLRQRQIKTEEGCFWPYIWPFEAESEGQLPKETENHSSWSFGISSVANSLYLAGRATQDKALMAFAEQSFLSLFAKQNGELNAMDPTFSTGKAGLLATTYQMAKMTNSGTLMQQASRLEQDLRGLYNPSHPFGFQMTHYTPSGTTNHLNDPGLLDGASGIALALLLVDGRANDIPWDRAFLLR